MKKIILLMIVVLSYTTINAQCIVGSCNNHKVSLYLKSDAAYVHTDSIDLPGASIGLGLAFSRYCELGITAEYAKHLGIGGNLTVNPININNFYMGVSVNPIYKPITKELELLGGINLGYYIYHGTIIYINESAGIIDKLNDYNKSRKIINKLSIGIKFIF